MWTKGRERERQKKKEGRSELCYPTGQLQLGSLRGNFYYYSFVLDEHSHIREVMPCQASELDLVRELRKVTTLTFSFRAI